MTDATETTPHDEVQKWTLELDAAEKFFEDFHKTGKKVIERYIDDRKSDAMPHEGARLNLFHANITTLKALMFAKMPKVEADRRFADPTDDIARVAGVIMTRCLENDMNAADCSLAPVLKYSLWDRLVPGMGLARVCYGYEEDKDADPIATLEDEKEPLYPKKDEWCREEYVHWRDVRWSPCRTYEELRWMAYRSYLTKEKAERRFGEDIAALLSYTSKGPESLLDNTAKKTAGLADQAEVWEIWDKDTKTTHWWSKGTAQLLDTKPDPLRLEEFWPSAKPMLANLTTDKLVPKADYTIAQDLYSKIDVVESRMSLLVDSCKAVGLYAGDAEAVKKLLQDGVENQLVPVDNWAMWAEKGGLKGSVEWWPIREIAEVLTLLTAQQAQMVQKLYQVTGMSDIMRGQASASGTTATEQKIKAQFGSVRINDLQEEFATFAADLLNKKVQIIRRFYDPQKILSLSNIMQTPDAQLAGPAIELIKSEGPEFNFRVVIRSESMAAVDMDSLKMERNEFLQGMAQFIGQATQLATTMPEVMPFLMQLMGFGLAGMKGSAEMEGVVDQAVAAMKQALEEKAKQPPQPSPEEKKMQMEGQLKQQEFQMKSQESQQGMQMDQQKMQTELQFKREEMELEKEKMMMELQFKREELAMKRQEFQQKLAMEQQKGQIDLAVTAQKGEQELEMNEQHAEHAADSHEAEEARAEQGFQQDQKRADVAAKADAKRASQKPKAGK